MGRGLRPDPYGTASGHRRVGLNAVAAYLGNPERTQRDQHVLPACTGTGAGHRYRFSASTVDQMPQQVALALMYGTELSVPVPDIDRTDLFVVIGANPLVSNGSMTVPRHAWPGSCPESARRTDGRGRPHPHPYG